MRTLISATTLVPGGTGGAETYVREIVRALQEQPSMSTRVLVAKSAQGIFPNDTVATATPGGSSTAGRLWSVLRGAVSGAVKRSGADVVHYPVSIAVPPPGRIPSVVTIHDLQHRELPELFSRAERAFRAVTYERAARRAHAIITVSEFAKTTIVRYLGVNPEKIIVAPLGVDATQFTANLGERENFVLYPARGWKHKNHRRLIEAMGLLRQRRPGIQLVLTGGALDSLGPVPDWVQVRGLVSLDELQRLYRQAAVLAFPSRYEGFGIPPLEAMASGCPVASSTAGSLPEVCGEAAEFFSPDSPIEMAEAMGRAIDRRNELASLGLDRVKQFTWERCAARHIEAFQRVARSR